MDCGLVTYSKRMRQPTGISLARSADRIAESFAEEVLTRDRLDGDELILMRAF
jgi:hypothetical protein